MILFISRDTCSDTIAKIIGACFCGGGGGGIVRGIAHLSHNTLQNGVSHRCACVKLNTKGGRIAPL